MTLMAAPTLLEIVAHARAGAEAREAALPLAELRARIAGLPATRGFAQALRAAAGQPGKGASQMAVIAEIKQASPSGGMLRAHFDAEAIALSYAASGVAGISVLTEPRYFAGSLARLARLRSVVDVPLLQKDFLTTAYQIYEARCCGADAVLLIAAVLDDARLAELAGTAAELGLDVLLEVHDEHELERALAVPTPLLGINNRNLKSYHIELGTTERLIAQLGNRAGNRLVVSESGIRNRADVLRLRQAGASAVLIGETLMRRSDIAEAYQELFGDDAR